MDRHNLTITIDEVLKEKNKTREQLCKDMQISKTTLEKYCKGDIRYLDTTFIEKVCFYLECNVQDILKYHK